MNHNLRIVWLVIRNEVITKFTQRSFLFAVFGLPVFGLLVLLGINLVGGSAPSMVGQLTTGSAATRPAAFVDQSGLITPEILAALPPNLARAVDALLIPVADESAAAQALADGKIGEYYVIPPDYVAAGEILFIRPGTPPLDQPASSHVLESVLAAALLGGDGQRASRVENPYQLQEQALTTQGARDESNPLTFILPYAFTLLFYFVIFGTASHNISSMTLEKENRVIEILMTTISPRQMFTGKILGLGIVGLFQALVWMGSGYAISRISGSTFSLGAEFDLPPMIFAWGLIFFLLGYTLYAALMAGIGALVPNLREASQAAFVVNSPLVLALMLIGVLINAPNGGLAIGMSLFPFTAPVIMMTRLSAGVAVPLWQLLLAVGLLLVTIVLVIRAVTGLFRAQVLLSGDHMTLGRFVGALAGRV